jgi:hypothetical protein
MKKKPLAEKPQQKGRAKERELGRAEKHGDQEHREDDDEKPEAAPGEHGAIE